MNNSEILNKNDAENSYKMTQRNLSSDQSKFETIDSSNRNENLARNLFDMLAGFGINHMEIDTSVYNIGKINERRNEKQNLQKHERK